MFISAADVSMNLTDSYKSSFKPYHLPDTHQLSERSMRIRDVSTCSYSCVRSALPCSGFIYYHRKLFCNLLRCVNPNLLRAAVDSQDANLLYVDQDTVIDKYLAVGKIFQIW